MNKLDTGDLRIDVDDGPEVLIAQWNGKSVDRQPQRFLDPFFATLLDEAQKRNLPIEMRFTRWPFDEHDESLDEKPAPDTVEAGPATGQNGTVRDCTRQVLTFRP